ncbi:SMI1/KNR4 family protein [Pseudomonas glycinae]|uniref:SMI1/KNR4 family protein n=1 Tax=Candidatus Pseudomonas auctus TaxID=3461260 RepID=UPI003B907777
MKHLWQRLEQHLVSQNPGVSAELNPGTTLEQVRALETAVGQNFSADFVESLLLHNGQRGSALPVFYGYRFLSCDEIQKEWKTWTSLLNAGKFKRFKAAPQTGIQDVWWHPAWVPFAATNEGDCLCLDLAPDAGGVYGQVISVWHDDDVRELKAGSFKQFVKSAAGE